MLQGLNFNDAIVNPDGTPTEYFMRLLQERGVLQSDTDALLEELLARQIIAGDGLDGGGPLSANVTLTADVQEILDLITNVRGSVIYRGASGWLSLAPGTAGQFLRTNGAGADPSWAAAGGSGGATGEAPWIQPTVAEFTTRVGTGKFADYEAGVIVSAPGTVASTNSINRATVPIVAGAAGWQATARFRMHFPLAQYAMAGLVVRNSTSGLMAMLSYGLDSVAGINRNTYNGDTAFVSVRGIINWPENDFWMRVKDDLTNRIWYISKDGYFWQQIYTETRTTFVTPDQVGFQLNPNLSGVTGGSANIRASIGMSVLSWQFQSLP